MNIVTFWSPIFGNALTNFLLSYKHGQWTIGLVIGYLNNHYLSSSCSTRAFLTAIQPSLSPSCCSTLLKPVEARIKMSITGFARRRNESPAASCFDISCTEVGINQGSAGVLWGKDCLWLMGGGKGSEIYSTMSGLEHWSLQLSGRQITC